MDKWDYLIAAAIVGFYLAVILFLSNSAVGV